MGCDGAPDGCYGGSLMPTATKEIWGNLSYLTKRVLSQATGPPPKQSLEPEVAIFIQGIGGPGALLSTVGGPGNDGNAYKYELAKQGFPVRWFLLEQLPDIVPKLRAMKLLILPSSGVMSERVRRAIRTLSAANRTIAWTGVPAALAAPNASGFSLRRTIETIGLRGLQNHSTPANLTTRLVQSTVPGAPRWPQGASVIGGIDGDGITSGEGGAASPWLHYNATAETGGGRVAVLGTFKDSGLASVVWRESATHRTFYSCNSALSVRRTAIPRAHGATHDSFAFRGRCGARSRLLPASTCTSPHLSRMPSKSAATCSWSIAERRTRRPMPRQQAAPSSCPRLRT